MDTSTSYTKPCKRRSFKIGSLVASIVIVTIASFTPSSAATTKAPPSQPPPCNGAMPRQLCEAIRRHTTHPEWANSPELAAIVHAESTNDRCAVNPSRHHVCGYTGTRACGWFQLNPCRCFETAVAQARCGVHYVESRYGDPVHAWQHWKRNRAY